jgi:RNA polymerase sigma-70 factor (ECF subfamily)
VTPREEAERIRRCRQGDADAWRSLVRQFHEPLRRLAYRILLNAEDTEDVVQDSWIRIMRALPRFDGRSSFQTWAAKIVVRQALTRAQSRKPEMSVEDPGIFDSGGSVGSGPSRIAVDEARRVETRLDIEAALIRLSPEDRAAVLLHFAEGHTFREVGQIMGIPQRTAADRAYRGLRQLQECMREEGPKTA